MGVRGRKVVIAGGTGFLGRGLAGYFSGLGDEVVVLSREAGAVVAGARVCGWDGVTVGAWARELEGAAAVINLAGRSVNCRYTRGRRREMMGSRVASTRVLGEAIGTCAVKPGVWMNSSTATIYRHTYGAAWDEAGEIGATREAKDAFSVEIARAWEGAFFGAEVPGVRKVALRTAIVLSARAGTMFAIVRRLTRLGLGGRMGDGRQYVSWIHEADFCRAIGFLMAHEEIAGVVNVAAPVAVTNAEMMGLFRAACGRRWGLPAGRGMLEVGAFLMRTETELVLKSRRVKPGRLMGAGFGFLYEEMGGAIGALMGGEGTFGMAGEGRVSPAAMR